MLRGLLAALIVGCLAAGRLPAAAVAAAAAAAFLALWLPLRHGHDHDNWTAIDYYAQQSRLHSVPAGLKALTALGMIVLVLAAGSPAVSLTALALAVFWTVAVGRTPAGTLLRLYAAPLSFVLLSGLALLFDLSGSPVGVIAVPCFGRYLTVSAEAQRTALRILLGAAASVSWLYALCLSTPLYELIAALGRIRTPEILIELMYLIYRYIFVLSATMTQMRTAAAARLGFAGVSASMRSTGRIMTSLLTASFQKASASFDAMQARCYDGRLRFLEDRLPLKMAHLLGAAATAAVAALAILLERGAVVMEAPLLQLQGVTFAYHGQPPALEQADLTLRPGERVALLGANGAGKSTLFLLLSGVLAPEAGQILLHGQPVGRRDRDLRLLRRAVGLVFQNPEDQLIGATVRSEISFGPMNLRLPEEQVRAAVDDAAGAMGVGGMLDRPPQYLSGGEKKRVTIADILAMNPEAVLLDEPTASLDPATRRCWRRRWSGSTTGGWRCWCPPTTWASPGAGLTGRWS